MMGKCIHPSTAVLFLAIYLSVSVYFISKTINSKTSMSHVLRSETVQYNPSLSSHHPWNKTERGLKYFLVKVKNMLEEDYSSSGVGSMSSLFERNNGKTNYMLTYINRLKALKESGSRLEKEPGICKSLVSGIDRTRWKAVRKVKSSQKKLGIRVYSDVNLTNVFNSCEKISSFIKSTFSNNSRGVKPIAYSILLNRPADQTFQLLRAIYHPSNVYCLHVHTDATKRYFALITKLVKCVDNFRLSDGRYKLTYATHHRIKAHLSCHRVLLNTNTTWKYLISVPGSVFPLRNNTFIADYLAKRNYLNGIAHSDPSNKSFMRRVNFVHKMVVYSGGYKVYARTNKRKDPPPYNMTLFRSDTSFLATRSFIEFVVTSNISVKLLQWAKDTKSPDEFFWATLDRFPGTPGGIPYRKDSNDIHTMMPVAEDIVSSNDNDLVVRLWKSQRTHKCGGKYIGNLCIFNYKDLRWLLTQDSLFADAFDIKVDNVVVGCLNKNLKQPLVEDYYPSIDIGYT